jgi:choline dehydrogenase-like flavoprotein
VFGGGGGARTAYLSEREARTLSAVADALLVPEGRIVPSVRVASNVDRFLADLGATSRWKLRLVLRALAVYPWVVRGRSWGHLPVARRRELLEGHLVAAAASDRTWAPLRSASRALVHGARQLAITGYYGDPEVATGLGFRSPPRGTGGPAPPPARALVCLRHGDVDRHERADVVIAGTGAGGATVGASLSAAGREVLFVERGPHVEPGSLPEGELDRVAALYGDGLLQISRDARFAVLQAHCVGGSTVVNNGVCFDLPRRTLDRWNATGGPDAGLAADALAEQFARLRQELRVRPITDTPEVVNPIAAHVGRGLAELGRDDLRLEPVDVNIEGCLGCGACNLGCPFGRKLSMLQSTLPAMQRAAGHDAVRILSDARVTTIDVASGRATGLRVRLRSGERVRITASTTVLSAGAIASSLIVRRSGLGRGLAGRGLSFNVGAAVTAEFEDVLDAHRSLQISHYVDLPALDVVLETWFNPLGSQAPFVPGWFEDHARRVGRYRHLGCLGVVAGVDRAGSVRNGPGGSTDLRFDLRAADLERVKTGMRLAAEILLLSGAVRVILPTFLGHEVTRVRDLDDALSSIRSLADVSLNSAHPAGGTPMSRDPRKGIVDEGLRVHGVEGLHIADASVLPGATTVNPQLTVMAVAGLAASTIHADTSRP